ncbi:MAG: hypothetical protein AABY07_08590 [Nanoarchaeota archaeon]
MKRKKFRYLKEKTVGVSSSISGATSVLGSYQICHNICLGLIALLSIIGITLVGMPLLFLTKVAIPFWIIAFLLLILTLFFYFKKGCISKKLIIFNSGLIIAGIPFKQVLHFSKYFMIIGGLFVTYSLILYFMDKFKRHKNSKNIH